MQPMVISLPNGIEWQLTPEEARRLFSLARLGIQAAKDRGMTSTTDGHLEATLHGNTVKF